jgi:hypothetical protein
MKKKPIWETKNPNEKSTKLSSKQKQKAKRIAKASGSTYPSLVANIAAMKGKK